MSDFHPIYDAAYYGAWQTRPEAGQGIHRGGLAPRLDRISQARIAIWCARRLVEVGSATDQAFDQALTTASDFLDRPDARHSSFEVPELDRRGWVTPPEAIDVVWRAVDAANKLRSHRRLASRRARACAFLTSRILSQREKYNLKRNYLDPLDELLLTEEFLQFGDRYRQNLRADFDSLVYRGSMVGHRTDLWLVLTQDATLGLLLKLGRHWKWFEGTESEVLPNIPDDHFAGAAESLAGSPTKGV